MLRSDSLPSLWNLQSDRVRKVTPFKNSKARHNLRYISQGQRPGDGFMLNFSYEKLRILLYLLKGLQSNAQRESAST